MTAFNSKGRHGSRSPKYVRLCRFTLVFSVFCRGRQRNVLKIPNTRTDPLFCSLNFRLVTLSLPSPSWFAKTPQCIETGNDNLYVPFVKEHKRLKRFRTINNEGLTLNCNGIIPRTLVRLL